VPAQGQRVKSAITWGHSKAMSSAVWKLEDQSCPGMPSMIKTLTSTPNVRKAMATLITSRRPALTRRRVSSVLRSPLSKPIERRHMPARLILSSNSLSNLPSRCSVSTLVIP